jgi:hypothetical protein
MNDEQFWLLVAKAREEAGELVETRPDELRDVLAELPCAEVQAFARL